MKSEMGTSKNNHEYTGLEIAVIGMDGRFPGAKNLDEYWDNLVNGIESISFFTREELAGIVNPEDLNHPDYVTAKGLLEDIDYFDAAFFGYTPREAEIMNPQMRIFHECAWAALEDAGYDPECYDGIIGAFTGAAQDTYWEFIATLTGKFSEFGAFEASLLSSKDTLGTWLSYKLNLTGPSFCLYTACSTSGTVLHQACQALLGGECHMALAGGVSLLLPRKAGYLYQEGMILSPDGHCRVFDADSKGSVFGDGVGVVILKLLDDALKDRDHIYAVIKGTALNNDGSRKVGYTAPGKNGQAAVMRTALHTSGVELESISYIETHGTGTNIGDTIELEAMKLAYNIDKKNVLGIGSVKSNIGHLNSASAMSGLIKTVLALKNRLIPPTLHLKQPNPKFDFENSPFFVVTEPLEWKNDQYPLRAGVSSFGMGGTNFHAILEEAPAVSKSVNQWVSESVRKETAGREYQLILLSAKTQSSLEQMTENLARYLEKNPGVNLADAAYTLQVGRRNYKHRRMLVASCVESAVQALSSPGETSSIDSAKVFSAVTEEKRRPVIFMFSGVGSQYVNMGLDLYRTEPLFREEMDRCFEILTSLMGDDIKEILYPDEATKTPRHQENISASDSEGTRGLAPLPREPATSTEKINETEIAQPVIFIFEYALARLLISWGIKPETMIGYSFGEYVAACIAGVFSLEHALKLVVSRAQLIRQTAEGAMLSIPVPVEDLKPLVEKDGSVSIAIDNGAATIVAGTREAVDAFEEKMKNRKYMCMRVDPSRQTRALHSKEMEPILKSFEEQVAQVTLKEPEIPYISNVTGKITNGNDVTHSGYWVRHLRETVQFAHGIKELVKERSAVFIEIGPGRDLCSLVGRYLEDNPDQHVINLVRHPGQDIPDVAYLLGKIGLLWLYRINIDWNGFYAHENRGRISLPSYPFDRKRYWIEGNPYDLLNSPKLLRPEETIRKKTDISDWFYVPVWKQLPPLPLLSSPGVEVKDSGASDCSPRVWLVLADDLGIGDRLVGCLKEQNQDIHVVTVKIGSGFNQNNDGIYTLDPCQEDDYKKLIKEICQAGPMPQQVVHLWSINGNIDGSDSWPLTAGTVSLAQDRGLYSFFYLVKALQEESITGTLQLAVITNNVQAVCGEAYLCPEQSTVLGPLTVISQENPSIRCRSIDILLPPPGRPHGGDFEKQRLAVQLLAELLAESPGKVLAFRDNHRWLQAYEPIKLEAPAPAPPDKIPGLREKGVYLVTGGLGSIGFALAEYLARAVKARVVLTGRSTFPARDSWDQWLAAHSPTDRVSQRIRKIREMEETGGKVLVVSADVADEDRMRAALLQAEEAFGPINGVIYSAGIGNPESYNLLGMLEKKHFEMHFQPKLWGLVTLEKVLAHKKTDFVLVMSSISSTLGGIGFSAYSAANIFIDSFIQQHNRESRGLWLGVNWDTWQLEGKHDPDSMGASIAELYMNAEEGVEAFKRVLSRVKFGRVIHSLGDLQARIDQWVNLKFLEDQDADRESLVLNTREQLTSPYEAPRNPFEEEVVKMWEDFFGFEKLGIYDDFFEVGGDSLKAISIVNKLKSKLKVDVPITIFFEEPTIEGIARYIQDAKKTGYSLMELAEKKEYYATNEWQKTIFIMNQLENIMETYNMVRASIAEGELDKQRIKNALRQLMQRQESLRSSYHLVGREIVMKIHHMDDINLPFEYMELQESGTHDLDHIIKTFSKPFCLNEPPQIRVKIVKLEKERYLLMCEIPHIIGDNESVRILARNLADLIEGSVLPELKWQYKDYTQWQQKFLESGEYKRQEAYWSDRFRGEIPLLNMPTDYPRPADQSFEGKWIRVAVEDRLIRSLKKIAEKTGTTLFMILLAAFNILLSRYTGQQDIIVGSAISGRDREELEEIIGVFMNVMPMRNFIRPDISFGDFLNQVKQNILEFLENQQYPLAKLLQKLDIKKDLSRNPLNDVQLIMVKDESPEMETDKAAQVRFIPYHYDPGVSPVDITLEVFEKGEEVTFILIYCTKLFKKETMENFIDSFKEVLERVVENNDILLKDITLSTTLKQAIPVFKVNEGNFEF